MQTREPSILLNGRRYEFARANLAHGKVSIPDHYPAKARVNGLITYINSHKLARTTGKRPNSLVACICKVSSIVVGHHSDSSSRAVYPKAYATSKTNRCCRRWIGLRLLLTLQEDIRAFEILRCAINILRERHGLKRLFGSQTLAWGRATYSPTNVFDVVGSFQRLLRDS